MNFTGSFGHHYVFCNKCPKFERKSEKSRWNKLDQLDI